MHDGSDVAHYIGEQPASDEYAAVRGVIARAERWLALDLLPQAVLMLAHTWTALSERDVWASDVLACEAACLLVRAGAYGDAAVWFGRVTRPPRSVAWWLKTQHTIVQLCTACHNERPAIEGHATPRLTGADRWSDAPPPLHITSFGRFQIARAGSLLPACAARRAIAIFRYLLIKPQHTAHREELMELFWPAANPRGAAHSLHVAICSLRRHLDAGAASYIVLENASYSLNPAATITADCGLFARLTDTAERHWRAGEHARASALYEEAVALYRGDYDTGPLEFPWALVERERLLVRYLQALERLGRCLIEERRFEAAAACFSHILDRDAYREDACYQLMRCYSQTGRRRDAIQQYWHCAEHLMRDLGVEPTDELQALYRTLLGLTSDNGLSRAVVCDS